MGGVENFSQLSLKHILESEEEKCIKIVILLFYLGVKDKDTLYFYFYFL